MNRLSKRLLKHILVALLIYFIVVVSGAAIISALESWRYVDSFYYSVIVSTTVGLGDFYPNTDGGKLFTAFYSVFGVSVFFYMLAIISVNNIESTIHE